MTDDFVNSFVGVPYEVNGRDRHGWDCWGLVMAAFQEVRGVRLPDWRVDPLPPGMTDPAASAARITEAVEAESAHAVLLDAPEPWAIAVVRRHRMAHHVGVVTPGGRLLHCAERTRGTVCEPVDRFLREYPNTTFWRWNG